MDVESINLGCLDKNNWSIIIWRPAKWRHFVSIFIFNSQQFHLCYSKYTSNMWPVLCLSANFFLACYVQLLTIHSRLAKCQLFKSGSIGNWVGAKIPLVYLVLGFNVLSHLYFIFGSKILLHLAPRFYCIWLQDFLCHKLASEVKKIWLQEVWASGISGTQWSQRFIFKQMNGGLVLICNFRQFLFTHTGPVAFTVTPLLFLLF